MTPIASTVLPASLSPSYITYDWVSTATSPSLTTYMNNKHSYVISTVPSLSQIPTRNPFQSSEESAEREVSIQSFLRKYADYHTRISSAFDPTLNLIINAVMLQTEESMF